ncbi:MAG: hypothetical protein KR126chlam3_01308 [Chlamydiae bacterium]|nr:hypothetical protein [Chlamydiota bacterium]
MWIKCFLGCLVCHLSSLFSAGPILHLWVAERFCEIYGIDDPDVLQGIFIGSEYPDIRYIVNFPRNLTHPTVVNFQEVTQSANPFELGMKLHSWLDFTRENFIDQTIYTVISSYEDHHAATLLKFIEEEILADFYDGRKWSFIFDKVMPEELIITPEEAVLKWHGMIQWTMSFRPSWLLWAQSYRGNAFGLSTETLYNWSYLIPELKQKPLFQNYLNALLEHLEAQLSEYESLDFIFNNHH